MKTARAKREQGALEPTQFAQCRGHTVLSRVGGQLALDQGGRHRACSNRGGDQQDFRPMDADQCDIDAAGD